MTVSILQAAAATTVTLDMNTIILAIIGLIPAIFTGLIALWQSKIAAEQKKQGIEQERGKEALKEIHTAVNSAKTALENKLEGYVKQNVELAKKVAELEENKRGSELAKAVAAAPVTPALAPASGKQVKLDIAIEQLTDAAQETVEAAEKTVEHAEKMPKK